MKYHPPQRARPGSNVAVMQVIPRHGPEDDISSIAETRAAERLSNSPRAAKWFPAASATVYTSTVFWCLADACRRYATASDEPGAGRLAMTTTSNIKSAVRDARFHIG